MTIYLSDSPKTNTKGLIIPLADQEQVNSRLQEIAQRFGLSADLLQAQFNAKASTVMHLHLPDGPHQQIHLLGLGKKPDFAACLSAFRALSYQHKDQLSDQIAVDWSFGDFATDIKQLTTLVEACLNGLALGTYDIGHYKTAKKKTHPLLSEAANIGIISPANQSAALEQVANAGLLTAATQIRILDLVNAPGNKLTPQVMAAWVKESGASHHYSVRVIEREEAKSIGLHALLAVNRGSEWPPAFIIAEYHPDQPKTKKTLPHIGLVGKGVTFDTGGLSIKGANNMHYMKSDMGGAAAVLGTIELCARLQIPARITAIVPATDNCVDALSVKPGDVIDSYSDQTIEVIDTDAEGRLILADGLAYMERQHQPDVMIDLATLTGSCVRALGYHAAGLFTQNDKLAAALTKAGDQNGERLWRLPLWASYKNDIESDVADIKNLGGPVAGAITAAKFLEAFTNEHPCWAHLDIAGVAFGNSLYSKQKSASAYGIRLLTDFIRQWGESK